ncbi:MAG: Na+/H+ antiporter subunit E [bacterium]|nr:Na+/H+ antiporter subunit E [bacterium]
MTASAVRSRALKSALRTALVPRYGVAIVGLVAVWCGLWGSVSVANVASGLLVAVFALALGFGVPSSLGVRVVPLVRLGWLVGVDLVKSTFTVAAEVLTWADNTAESIVAVPVSVGGRMHFLLLVVAITLTPGTAVVDTDSTEGIIYLHLLHHERRAETIAHVQELVELAALALSPGIERAGGSNLRQAESEQAESLSAESTESAQAEPKQAGR